MQNHNDTIKTSDTVLRKIYLSLYWKGCVWEGVGNRIELQHIDPHSIGHNRVSFPFYWVAQPGTWGPILSGTFSHSSIFSPTRLISKLQLLNWGSEGPLCWVLAFSTASCLQLVWSPNCTELYNSSTPTFFLWVSLIQPIHGQGYTLLFLDWMHLVFIRVHFLFWQPSRVLGQYTTLFLIIKFAALILHNKNKI